MNYDSFFESNFECIHEQFVALKEYLDIFPQYFANKFQSGLHPTIQIYSMGMRLRDEIGFSESKMKMGKSFWKVKSPIDEY